MKRTFVSWLRARGGAHAFLFTSLVICTLVSPLPAFAKPRPPLPPWPETSLLKWSFDEPLWYAYLQRNSGQSVAIDSSIWVESWSGYALNRQGTKLPPVALPMATTNQWNVAPDEGAIRFWFSPSWSSAGTASGKGPGHYARLLELSTHSGQEGVVYWSLHVSPDGHSLYLSGQGEEGPVDFLKTDIAWQAGEWHLISLSYGAASSLTSPVPWLHRQPETPEQEVRVTALQVDGQLAAVGPGLPVVPPLLAGTVKLTVGSDVSGGDTASGQFEELATFDYPLTWWQWAYYYETYRATAALGPVTPEDEATRRAAALALRTERASSLALAAAAGTMEGMSSLYVPMSGDTNGFWLTPPVIEGTNISLTLCNTATNKSYDIYFTSALVHSNTLWQVIVARGSQGQTNFPNFTNTTLLGNLGFFRAFEGSDWDGDGIPNWMDANPSSTNVGALTITIESPAHGSMIH